MTEHESYMRRCLELAQRAKGYTAPNPMVGAVLVHEDRIIGEGWHRHYGEAHAEVNCFEQVSAADRHLIPESTMYVSLEPCAHYGKTPPCARRIVQERVKEVIIANKDPFPQVSGNGISILEEAGIAVQTGILADEARWVNRRFFCFHEHRRPYIILKWAESADGFIAPADRSRYQLSDRYSNALVHQWRTEEAAILVGFHTAMNDNPRLTARHRPGRQPLRIALDRALKLPQTHYLFDEETPTWVLNEREERTSGYLQLVLLPFDDLLLPALLGRLYQEQKLSLIVEGGAALLNSFIKAGLWDEARVLTTRMPLQHGIAAPELTHGTLCSETPLKADTLRLWTNSATDYPYVKGCAL